MPAKVFPDDSRKEKTFQSNGTRYDQSTWSIIASLCFTAACHAVDGNFEELYIFPLYSSKRQHQQLCVMWTQAMRMCMEIFHLQIRCLISAKHHQLLYKSLVASEYRSEHVMSNMLELDINIGDSITEMSAVGIDKYEKRELLAHCTLPFAGKNLLKGSIKNMLVHTKQEAYKIRFLEHLIKDSDFGTNDAIGRILNFQKVYIQNDGWMHYLDMIFQDHVLTPLEETDIKFQADVLLRYGALLAVVRNFFETVIHMCGHAYSNFAICFSGNAAQLLKQLDITSYFRQLVKDCYCTITETQKSRILKNMEKITFIPESDGFQLIGMDIKIPDGDQIDVDAFHRIPSSLREPYCEAFHFQAYTGSGTEQYHENNLKALHNPANSMPDEEVLWKDLKDYYSSITDTLCHDSIVKGILEIFLNDYAPGVWKDVMQELRPPEAAARTSAFGKACLAEVYL